MASSSVHSESMVAYSRDKKTNCRDCDVIISNVREAIVCGACGWMFHPNCTKLSPTQITCQVNDKGALAQLVFNCAWCKNAMKKYKDHWRVYDVQSNLVTVDLGLREEKKLWLNKLNALQVKTNKFRDLVLDMQRNAKLERVALKDIEKELRDNANVIASKDFDELNDKFKVLNETYIKCSAELKKVRDNTTRTTKLPAKETDDQVIQRPTYAEALKNSNVSNKIIRRVAVGDENVEILKNITSADVSTIPGLAKVFSRDAKTATLIFDTEDAVTTFENDAAEKFPGIMTVDQVREYIPKMKIVCLPGIETPALELLNDSKLQNTVDVSVEFVRDYVVTTPRRTYRNFIVSCSLDSLKEYLKNGIVLSIGRFRCYEYVQTMQCYKCYDYGHISSRCQNSVICRRCGEKHLSTECTDETGKLTCANCKIAGRNFDHSVTAENCPRRIERVNGLIDFLLKKGTA